MSDEKCPRCDRAECPTMEGRRRGFVRIDESYYDCKAHAVDWRARALAASPRTPPPEVLRAAERIGELAQECSPAPWAEVVWYGTDEGGWAAVGPHHTGGDDECDDDASDNHARAERDAAFIAECRTLAVVLAEWVKGGGR